MSNKYTSISHYDSKVQNKKLPGLGCHHSSPKQYLKVQIIKIDVTNFWLEKSERAEIGFKGWYYAGVCVKDRETWRGRFQGSISQLAKGNNDDDDDDDDDDDKDEASIDIA